jgi:acetate kinase
MSTRTGDLDPGLVYYPCQPSKGEWVRIKSFVGAMQSSLVGGSGERLRAALKVVEAVILSDRRTDRTEHPP